MMEKTELCPGCLKAIEELEKRFRVELDGKERALTIASVDLEKRLDGLNEIRNAMADQALRTEEGIGKRLAALELVKANLDGKFWALTAVMFLLQITLQLWSYLKIK